VFYYWLNSFDLLVFNWKESFVESYKIHYRNI
jgi:hypothetical protein